MNPTVLLPFVLLLVIGSAHAGGGKPKRCKQNTYFVSLEAGEIKCETCPSCPLGEGFDTNVKLNRSKVLGFLNCPPCKACADGYYRSSDRLETCTKCKKDCSHEERVWKTPCGGDNIGECGDCLEGYIPTRDGICKIEEIQVDLEVQANPEVVVHNTVNNSTSSMDAAAVILIIVGVLILLAVSVNFLRRIVKNNRGEPTRQTIQSGKSGEALLQSNVSSLGETNSGSCTVQIGHTESQREYEDVNVQYSSPVKDEEATVETERLLPPPDLCDRKSDLEVDGPPSEPRPELSKGVCQNHEPPRGELGTDVRGTIKDIDVKETARATAVMETARDTDITETEVNTSLDSEQIVKKYANKVLKKDSKELRLASSRISGDCVFALFRSLGLIDANYEPERELWSDNKQAYKDYILNVLKIWLEQKPKSTLSDLWSALKRFRYDDAQCAIIKYLIKLDREEKSANANNAAAAATDSDAAVADGKDIINADDASNNENDDVDIEKISIEEKSCDHLSVGELFDESIES